MEKNIVNYNTLESASMENNPDILTDKPKENKETELKPLPEIAEEGPNGDVYLGIRTPGEIDFNEDNVIFPK